jgi:peroxiredoxin
MKPMAFIRTCALPDIELSGANGSRVNPSDFAGHELIVLFCPAKLPDATQELAEYNALADAIAFNDAYMIAICDPKAGSPASRVTLASDPQGLAWNLLAECLSPQERMEPDKGAAFLMGRGGCLKRSWHGSGHAQSVRHALGERM